MQSVLQFILGGVALIKSVLADAEVLAYLAGRKNLLDPAPVGLQMGEAAKRQEEEREGEEAERVELTNRIEAEFEALRVEVHDFLFAAQRDLAKVPALAKKLGVKLPRHHRKGKEAQAAGGGAHPPATEPPAGEPAAGDAEAKVRKHRIPRLARFLASSKALIKKALAEPGVIAAMTPHGYTAEELTALSSRLVALEGLSQEQGVAKKTTRAATAGLRDAVKGFRGWFTPWKRRLTHALKGRDDLRTKLGLPVRKRHGAAKEGDAQPEHGKAPRRGHRGQPKPPAPVPPAPQPPVPPKAQ